MNVPPPTAVELAIDFTPDLGLAYEAGWRAFQLRSGQYAAQFRSVNANQIWVPHGGEAKAAAALRKKDQVKSILITWIFGSALLLWILWVEVLKDVVMPWLRP